MIEGIFAKVFKLRNTHANDRLDAGGRAMPKAVAGNIKSKEGQHPGAWNKLEAQIKCRQKDPEGRWTKKNDKNHCGYKNHIKTDAGNKLIQNYAKTHAAVQDCQVFICCSGIGLK